MNRRALITGATGLVGSHIVERLRADGWSIRALSRDPDRDRWLETRGAELHRGDVLDAESVKAAARGCTHVFHTAAAVTPRGGWDAYHSVNVQGTGHVIDAAAESGARLLQLSSVAVYGPTARYQSSVTDERTPLPPLDDALFYARTKRASEQMALAAHASGRVWATAIRPCVIYGRRDRQFVPRMARLVRRGFVPLPGGGKSALAIIHAASVAHAAVLAATNDVAGGKAYNVANESPTAGRDFFRLAGEGLGRRVRIIPIPVFLARAGLAVARLVLSLSHGRGTAAMSRGSLGFLTRDNPFSSALAERELGWTPQIDPRAAIPDAFGWWRDSRGMDGK